MSVGRKFLIIRLSAIGDIVHALPMAKVLKDNFSNCTVDWVTGDACKSLIENNPLIDNCYSIPLGEWKKNWLSPKTVKEICGFNKMLQKNNYDYAFDAHGMFKSAVILAFCGAKKRVAYKDYREGAVLAANVLVEPRSKRPHINYHVVKRHLDMLEEALGIKCENPIARLPESSKEDKKHVEDILPKVKPIVVFAPATTWDNKHWAVENWQKLYSLTKDRAQVVFTGVQKDLELIGQITQGCDKCTILAGKTNLAQYIETLRRADIVVSPDSSASHLAYACNSPKIITIFCATSKNTFAPLGENNVAFPCGEPVCIPCHKRKCKYGHKKCTHQTGAEEVFESISEILSKKPPKSSRKS